MQALQVGCLNTTCIELDDDNIEVLGHMLTKSSVLIIKSDLSKKENLNILNGNCDTIFYLAVHQHLEQQSQGSGFMLLDFLIDLISRHIVTRAKGYSDELQAVLKNKFGNHTYYSHLETGIDPIFGFTAG